MWFLEDPKLLARERAAIEDLKRTAQWLVGANWLITEGCLCLDAVIRAHDHDYQVRMTYPSLFASVPPIICPQNAHERWSGHQYGGVDGPLCLQWGPDNWHPDITGAQMLESAYNLLNIENPLGSDRSDKMISAPSRHRLLVGQEVRADAHRLYVGTDLASYLAMLPPQACGTIEFSLHFASTALRARALIHKVTPTGSAQSWSDTTIPKSLRGRDDSRIEEGFFFSTDLSAETIVGISDVQGLQSLLARLGHNPELLGPNDSARQQIIGVAKQPAGVLLIDSAHTPHFFFLLDSGSVIELKAVFADSRAQDSRIPETYKALSGKSVGIVGAGSAGSKIALTLARMGVLSFFLVALPIK